MCMYIHKEVCTTKYVSDCMHENRVVNLLNVSIYCCYERFYDTNHALNEQFF